MNTSEFIEKSKKIHGNKYDYSSVNYVGITEPVTIICPKHGAFEQRPKNHLKGYGCKKCGRDTVSKKLAYTTEKFISKARKIHQGKYDYSKVEYTNNHTKVCIICPKHGEFWQTPNDHIDNHGCMKCRDEKTKTNLSDTKDTFIQKSRQKHGDKYDYSKVEYSKSDVKVCIICPKHGEFWQTPHQHIRGEGCPKCANIERVKPRTLTTDEFIARSSKKHDNKYDYSKSEYVNWFTHVKIICPEHGEFWQRAGDHMNGHGCDRCFSSNLEKEVMTCLELNNIKYIHHVTSSTFKWLGYKHLDFYLPDYKIAIECQGDQHFKPVTFGGISESKSIANFKTQQKRDQDKLKLCTDNGIKVLYFSSHKYRYLYNIITNKTKLLEEIKNGKPIERKV